jgi:general secretion pathway protein E
MRKPILDIVREKFPFSESALADFQKCSNEKGQKFRELLVRKKILTEAQLLETLSDQYTIPFWPELPLSNSDNGFTNLVPIHFLKRHTMVPLKQTGNNHGKSGGHHQNESEKWIVAVNDPSSFQPMDDLIRLIGIEEHMVVLAPREAILSAINMFYDTVRDSAEQLVQNMEENGHAVIGEIQVTEDLLDDTSDAPIIKLVNHILSQAIKARASDIHIEPYQESFKVRYRVDGILYDLLSPPKWIQSSLISRIKVMAKLDIAEKRLPQDGRLEVKMGDQDIDIRISTIPTSFGERLVLRLLNKTSTLFKISELGLEPEILALLEKLVHVPHGIILVTGPTGSGKTTTLYAVLSSINTPDINIITIEDPVEYQIPGISQIQVNPKIGLTFARGLRSIVRQDPDVILVGEIRDRETAEIAVQSALTGHLVFSTLHTNDSASAITRLVDIGVEPFLISSSVIAVFAQRLIRVLCPHCKIPCSADDISLGILGLSQEKISGRTIYKPKGCPDCIQTGYRGRIGIFEIMVLDEKIKSLIVSSHDAGTIREEASKNQFVTLREDGLGKILKGITSPEEILRVTRL